MKPTTFFVCTFVVLFQIYCTVNAADDTSTVNNGTITSSGPGVGSPTTSNPNPQNLRDILLALRQNYNDGTTNTLRTALIPLNGLIGLLTGTSSVQDIIDEAEQRVVGGTIRTFADLVAYFGGVGYILKS